MSDFPRGKALVLPLHISTFGRWSNIQMQKQGAASAAPSATTWISGLIVYTPIAIPFPYPVNRVWWINGSTITTTHVEFGIYTSGGAKVYSTGSVTQVGASTVQYVTPATPFVLPPDRYYFAWVCDNTSSRGYTPTITNANQGRLCGLLQEAASIPIPASMTPASFAQTFGAPVCGITRTPSGF
jgi:hypothetical protein